MKMTRNLIIDGKLVTNFSQNVVIHIAGTSWSAVSDNCMVSNKSMGLKEEKMTKECNCHVS